MTPLIPVVLSGGAGTRLWPVSREALPKPFMRLPDGRSLLRRTVERAAALADALPALIVTGREYYFLSRDELAGARTGGQAQYLLEPVGRNTAPAIVLAALAVASRHGEQAQMIALPADHLIDDEPGFRRAVRQAQAAAADGWLVTFGMRAERPATGYGYIKAGASLMEGVWRVERFVEKPSLATAQSYVASGDHHWNSGMFLFRAGDLLAAFAAYKPELLRAARACWDSSRDQRVAGDAIELQRGSFGVLESVSIDYAIMEHADRVAVVPGAFGWSDVGAWNELAEHFAADERGNRADADALFVDSDGCFVYGAGRLVATLGLKNVYIVDTPDALLVLDKARAQDVKQVVDAVRAQGGDQHFHHVTVARPWGSYTVLQEAPGFKIKRVEVKPGGALSLQMHRHRSEHWIVVGGTAKVTNGDREFLVGTNESTYIPAGTRHRLENPGTDPLVLIEVQSGPYLGEDDIVRFEDRYGRVVAPTGG
ncbi:MAG: mannose-1-phosphate guanylyltransferase/mannose-6-phosphate isomerase [Betaproteobacteria bacterium]|jgi:mannose-1-phosphate guanylyltransferase/mannose-6-phosphate isomerase